MRYTIFDISNGQILSNIDCPPDNIGAYLTNRLDGKTVSYVEDFYSPDQYRIENNTPVPLGPRPSPYYFWDFSKSAWTLDENLLEIDLRQKRNQLLVNSDWTQLKDVQNIDVAAWQTYRQELRDVTKQSGWPTNVVWPTAP